MATQNSCIASASRPRQSEALIRAPSKAVPGILDWESHQGGFRRETLLAWDDSKCRIPLGKLRWLGLATYTREAAEATMFLLIVDSESHQAGCRCDTVLGMIQIHQKDQYS